MPMNRAIGPAGEQPRDALEVGDRGADDVHARVGIVDPVDRHLVDAQPAPLREHQQLGVEEPALVLDVVDQRVEHVAADGLEAALRVAELRAQDRVQDAVVAARDELALRAAHDPRAVRQPRADREVAVAGHQRRDEREQPAQVGREVDVHVGDDPRRAAPTRRRAARGRGPCGRAAGGCTRGQRCREPARRSPAWRRRCALSAITIRQLNGKPSVRKRCRRRMLRSSPAASL